jgi:hypothetical protein
MSLNVSTPVTIDPRRSLAVTDDAILASFSLKAVMDQLVTQAKVSGLTSLKLYQQWWSTAVTCPPPNPRIAQFGYQCPRAEGQQATENPFATPATDASYVPIGLFNRFDLAPANGADCGEYRIIFARRSGFTNPTDRNLIIFEAVLPNPTPAQGLKGCTAVAQFWAGLTQVNDVHQRAAQLQNFYFKGLTGFEPVVHVNHYGANGKGQIRTNQFMQFNWMLREFKLTRTAGTIEILPATVKVNPFGPLFSPTATESQKAALNSALVAAVPTLAVNNINTFIWTPSDAFNASQSDQQSIESNYSAQFASGGGGGGSGSGGSDGGTSGGSDGGTIVGFDGGIGGIHDLGLGGGEPDGGGVHDLGFGGGRDLAIGGGGFDGGTGGGTDGGTGGGGGGSTDPLRTALAAKLKSIGSKLGPDDIVARAQALSCAGCHELSNGANLGGGITWPSSLTFTQVSEQTEAGPDGARHLVSSALSNVFLPHRAAVLTNFLPPVCVPKTCAQLGAQCGSIGNGCGGTLSCGSCAAGHTCSANKCN